MAEHTTGAALRATASTASGVKARRAPQPDDPRKPDNPTDLHKRSWRYVLRRTLHEFSWDQCTTLAAGLTFYAILSMFPALLAILSLLGLFGQADRTTATILEIAEAVADPALVDSIRDPIQQLATASGAGFSFVVGLIGATWTTSSYVNAFAKAMNRIYEVDEGRPFWKLRPIMLLVTVVLLMITGIMAALLIVSGPVADAIGSVIGIGPAAVFVWDIFKWPVLIGFAIVLIAVLYYATPNVRQPRFRWMSIGSFIALVMLALASLGFFFYVDNFSSYNKTYGSIGGIVVLLLWLWIANIALLFGAEFDAEMERARELQGGIRAEESIQLPPRDSRRSKKQRAKENEDVIRGTQMRRRYDGG